MCCYVMRAYYTLLISDWDVEYAMFWQIWQSVHIVV